MTGKDRVQEECCIISRMSLKNRARLRLPLCGRGEKEKTPRSRRCVTPSRRVRRVGDADAVSPKEAHGERGILYAGGMSGTFQLKQHKFFSPHAPLYEKKAPNLMYFSINISLTFRR